MIQELGCIIEQMDDETSWSTGTRYQGTEYQVIGRARSDTNVS